ncbi:uncharacterized protein [Ranitomeya imitator]|uniref:uncharacterized protein n=1 Tax=Ranitomeya imitator TaxID=111125 RepID=UPI0037E74D2B
MFPEPTTTEHNQLPVEELMYQNPTPRNSPDSRAPKKQLGPGCRKGKACKLKPRRIFTKENIPELMESLAEATEDATAIIHHTSLSPKRKVMRKTPPAPLQPLQITENGAAPAWPAIQTANGAVRAYPLSPICVVQDAGNPVPSDHREIPHSSTGQPSTIRMKEEIKKCESKLSNFNKETMETPFQQKLKTIIDQFERDIIQRKRSKFQRDNDAEGAIGGGRRKARITQKEKPAMEELVTNIQEGDSIQQETLISSSEDTNLQGNLQMVNLSSYNLSDVEIQVLSKGQVELSSEEMSG